jgi:DNA-binding transcriptional MerR regulator
MYFVINRLDENRLARLEFLVNFGVSLSDIKQIQEAMEYGGTYEEVKQNTFKQLPFL